jgi:putative flippase GtrA
MANRKSHPKLIQFAEYMISGGAYFWSGYLVFFGLDKGLHLSLWWAKLGSNIAGWTVNYLLQRYWVFKNPKLRENQTQVTNRYIIITLVDFLMDYGIVWGLKSFGVTPYIGQFISAGFFTGWNYAWYRFWVFPEKLKTKARVTVPRTIVHRAHGHSAYRKASK